MIGVCQYLPQSLKSVNYHRRFYIEADLIWNDFGIHLSLSIFIKHYLVSLYYHYSLFIKHIQELKQFLSYKTLVFILTDISLKAYWAKRVLSVKIAENAIFLCDKFSTNYHKHVQISVKASVYWANRIYESVSKNNTSLWTRIEVHKSNSQKIFFLSNIVTKRQVIISINHSLH